MWILQDVIKIFFVILRRVTKYNLSIYFIVSKSVSCNKILAILKQNFETLILTNIKISYCPSTCFSRRGKIRTHFYTSWRLTDATPLIWMQIEKK